MKKISNPSGSGFLFEQQDIGGPIFAVCSACMSLYAEWLSWANNPYNRERVTRIPDNATNIIILSCQVTDLAIVNDFHIAEKYHKEFPNARIFISGCLARRFDIQFPSWLKRLDNLVSNGQFIYNRDLVKFEAPFWTKEFKEEDGELTEGHLFRSKYPFRIGVGCGNKCSYCSIRYTRGSPYQIESIDEFKQADDMVLIADSPIAEQILFWMGKAKQYNKRIAIRNLEPQVAITIWPEILSFAKTRLLSIFHCPVQASNHEVLRDMGRNRKATQRILNEITILKEFDVITATNIIRDYKYFKNDFDNIYSVFDYVSWNPYWDGKWDRKIAEEKFIKYFPWNR